MASLDAVSLTILLGALLVLAGILSSVLALRFGAPLLLVFLLIGMLAGESGPGGLQFNNVGVAYTVGAVALALILFDGGLKTRFQIFRNVMAPAGLLATVGVLITAAVVAPVAHLLLHVGWVEGLLIGSVIASTDAAAVLLLIHAGGLRLRPRVNAVLEVESATNDPFAIFLTILLIEVLLGESTSWTAMLLDLAQKTFVGGLAGVVFGYGIVLVLNRFGLPAGLHAPFVATGALVLFGAAEAAGGSGYLAAYVAGLVVGNRPTRSHGTVVVFLDAATWLAQIVMFTILGMLAWPQRLPATLLAAIAIGGVLMFVARPVAVFLCLAPFRFALREKLFISWVGLRGAVGIFLASIPLLVGMGKAYIYFDVAFVIVVVSLLVQGWTLTFAAHRLNVALPPVDTTPRRVELDLPGTLEQELVGYPVRAASLYLRRNMIPRWAKLALVVRDERVLSPAEAGAVRDADYAYFLAPPDRARALDRFFVDTPAPASPDQRLLGDFFVPGDTPLGALAEIYGLQIAAPDVGVLLADYFRAKTPHAVRVGDRVPFAGIELIADRIEDGRVITVGLDLAEPEEQPPTMVSRPQRLVDWLRRTARRVNR